MIVRFALLLAVLGAGSALGLVGRWAAHRQVPADVGHAGDLARGLWLFTAPYCHRCVQLRRRLDAIRPVIAYETVDVCERPDLVRALDIRSAPTLLAIGANGRLLDRLAGECTDEGLARVVRAVTAANETHGSRTN